MRSVIILLLLASSFISHSPPVYAKEIKIGVLAVRGNENAVKRWHPLTEYLKQKIGNVTVSIVPLDLHQMRMALENRYIDFVLTNTGNFVELEQKYGLNALATLKNSGYGRPLTQYGSVLFTRKQRLDIRTIDDLKGKTVMAVDKNAFGGFQMVWRELRDLGMNPMRDYRMKFSGLPQDEIVTSVVDGLADAGIVRSGTIELMHSEGLIDMSDLQVIRARLDLQDYPYITSTRLYPEWPLAKPAYTSEDLAKKVAVALLTMPEDHPIARQGRYAGWTVPMDYSDVHRLFRELQVGPYAGHKSFFSVNFDEPLVFYITCLSLLAFITIVLLNPLRGMMRSRHHHPVHRA